jgi:septal ring factor EnvC (AmiA/AmiB activator)
MRRLALLFVLALFCWASSWAQEAPISLPVETGPSAPIYASELARCLAISARLGEISQELETKLAASEQTSETLRIELSGLRVELETQSSELAELKAKLEASETSSQELEASLAKAAASLSSLQQSWDEYRIAAEAQIKQSKRAAALWRLAALASAGGLAGAAFGPAGVLIGAAAGAATGGAWWAVDERAMISQAIGINNHQPEIHRK